MTRIPSVGRAAVGALALLAVAFAFLAARPAVAAASTFDHFTTGFELVGEHRMAPCASCHVGGIFKGTPHDCSACHTPGSRIGATAKPVKHILSGTDCSQCHTPFAWKPVANFNHLNVVGTCSSCHNSVQSIGKPSTHIPTTAECSSCHLPMLSWRAAHFAHTGITGNCVSCHDNVHAPGQPAKHVPTSAPCESCHAPTNFTTFAGTAMNHAGIVNNCQACHETGMSWYGLTMVDRPTPAQDGAHPLATAPNGADCSTCHTGFNVGDFKLNSKPANHIPVAASSTCQNCHTTTNFATIPTLANIHLYAPSTTSNCSQCHGAAAASFAIPAASFSIVGLPTGHVPTTASCEACHVGAGSSIAATPVPNGAKFTNSAMSHAGITTGCATCHGPTITGSTFAGITKIIVMPPTSPVGANSHVPSGTVCESCHVGSTPAGLVPANATLTAPGTKFATPIPTTAQIHTGITTGCAGCHETNDVWMGMASYPIVPATLSGSSSTQYLGFNTRPAKTASSAFTIADGAHPTSGDCGQCHTGTTYFAGNVKPANHIPTAATATCESCHKGADFSVMPALVDIHANAPSTTSNCSQCHGSAAASFAIPAASFSIVGLPTGHVPTTASCEACHVGAGSSIAATPVPNGAKFTNSAMSHAGITTGCATCHGPAITGSTFTGITKIIVMPPTTPAGASSHVPSGTVCESCHVGSTPAGLVPANATLTAPGTKFATPIPTTAQIHAGVTTGCSNCHESLNVWMGMGSYPITPSALTGNASTQYLGFNVRPGAAAGTFTIADPAHPASGDCSQCHSSTAYFDGNLQPKNHIPTAATSTCANCHTTSNFATLPTLANIHLYAPSTTSNCTQCHGSAAASFAIPAAGFSIVGLPSGHVPTTASCEACHVGAGSSIAATPVPNGAKFSGSAMSHAGITSGCNACHGAQVTSGTFYGITRITVLPPATPAGGATSHIPTSLDCSTCHSHGTALVPGNAVVLTPPGTNWASPVPTTAMIHTGISSGCNACHEAGYAWLDSANYPISPTTLSANTATQYVGFNTRPGSAGGTYTIADSAHPATGDCSACHSSTIYFEGNLKPSNHIPTLATATCANCHTTGNFATIPTLANIHLYAPSTSTNCTQCHGAAAASFAIPAASFSIVGLPTGHIPTTASCEACHVGAGSSIAATPVPNGATFKNSAMSHAGITTGCVTCHGPTITGATFAGITKIVVMPATSPAGASSHVPSGTTCETCHLGSTPAAFVPANATLTAPGTKFATPVPTTAQIHSGITSGCTSCHETAAVWMDMAKYPISPATLSANSSTQYTGFNTRPGIAGTFAIGDPAHPATGDCVQCHANTNYFEGNLKPSNHIPTLATATCANCHTTSNFATIPTLANIHLYAPSTTSNCTQCHGSAAASFAIPAASFSIVGLPTGHIPTTASCEACHVGAGSSIAATPVPNGATFKNSAMSHTGITTGCVTCHGPTVTGATFAGITKIVVMPASSPSGANSHVPSGTTCETCHIGSTPAALVPANATLTAPGTKFATPIPTTAQIHTGISSGCSSCHESNYVWMGMTYYPISPKTLSANQATQYIGFNTRPGVAASTYSVADAAHPTSGDCATCHGGNFNYFSGQAEPSNHIPTLTQACSTCHTTAGNFAVYTTNLTALHSVVTTACSTCHADGKGPFAGVAGFTIVQMSTRGLHIPITKSGVAVECSGCHKSVTAFSGTIMSHSAIGDAGTSAAGNACDACHEFGMRNKWFGLSTWQRDSANHYYCAPGGTTICANGGADCTTGCHQHSVSSKYAAAPKPAVKKQTGASVAAALAAAPGSHFDHTTVADRCISCHDGSRAVAKPANHPASGINCDRCHTTSAWRPAAFDHSGVSGGNCVSCHKAPTATAKLARHVVTTASCDSCHYVLAWTPVKPANTQTPATQPTTPALRPVTPPRRPPVTPRPGATTPSARAADPQAPGS